MVDSVCSCAAHQQPRCVHFRMGNCEEKVGLRLVSPGNGALEKMREYFRSEHNWPTHIPAMTEADYFLAWLWLEGFKVVPLSGGDVEKGKQPHQKE